jgi:hypothetical protein
VMIRSVVGLSDSNDGPWRWDLSVPVCFLGVGIVLVIIHAHTSC